MCSVARQDLQFIVLIREDANPYNYKSKNILLNYLKTLSDGPVEGSKTQSPG